MAKKTLGVVTQLMKQDGNSSLSRNLSINGRVLSYSHIHYYFFSDTFCVTKKGKCTRGYKYTKLFTSDKGFMFVVGKATRSKCS